ncbi:SDR family oxidoreductase shroud [Xylocopa sonorina]|uniref:SDR family oxidoreductase shroud n=1 Tax=Xylocopa sonorina TaxID=1818115 RepID=UPI00403AA96E
MELVKCVKRYSTIIVADLVALISFFYLWNQEYKHLVQAMSLYCIGGTYLYCRLKAREKISSNQAVVVTGCDSGLGYSLAVHCRQLGATVIASALKIDGTGAKQLEKEGVLVYPLDVTKTESINDFTDSVRTVLNERKLVLRCLINNAAVMIFGEFEWQTDEQLRNQVEVNFLGTMRITRGLLPTIRAHSSRIIVISSHCNIQPIPGVAAYSGTKAALSAWATAIRLELKKYGVKVVCFVPGSFVGESNILARQAEHFETMRRSMSTEVETFYGDYFARYSRYFSSVGHGTNLKKLQDPGVYEVFEGALLDKYPSAVYKNESWRYFVYHALFTVTPTWLRDALVQRFVQGPSWSKRDVVGSSTVNELQEWREVTSETLRLKNQDRDENETLDKN